MRKLLETRRVFVIMVGVGIFTMAVRWVTDPDVWWHLRTGQLILQNHSVFHSDPYSFTRAGQPWVDHEWLSQVVIFALYRLAGWAGLMAAFSSVITVALLLVFLRCPRRPYVAGLVTVWGAVASVPSWGSRPQMFSFLLASMFLFILERSDERPNLLWWTPALMLLWANLHAGYALGIALLVLFFLGDILDATFGFREWPETTRRLRMLALVIATCLAVVPLNPYGLRMYSYPLETLRSRAMPLYINEWFSPDFHQHKYLASLLMMLTTLVLPVFSPRRLRPREILLLLVTTYAALRSVRHIPIYVLVAVPVVSALLQGCLENFGVAHRFESAPTALTQSKMLLNALLLAGFLGFAALRFNWVLQRQGQAEQKAFPAEAVAFLSMRRPPSPLLNHYNWGGYFIWKLYPEYKVYIDGRADVYGDAFMDDFASTYYVKGEAWSGPLMKWGVRTVVLPPDAPLVTALQAMPDWRIIHADTQAVILTKTR